MGIEKECIKEELYDIHRLESKFLKFHEENPDIYDSLVRLARQAKKSGHRKIGIGMLWEVMRWEHILQSKDSDGYKLNNSLRSRYARTIMEKEKDLEGFFETRKLRAD